MEAVGMYDRAGAVVLEMQLLTEVEDSKCVTQDDHFADLAVVTMKVLLVLRDSVV